MYTSLYPTRNSKFLFSNSALGGRSKFLIISLGDYFACQRNLWAKSHLRPFHIKSSTGLPFTDRIQVTYAEQPLTPTAFQIHPSEASSESPIMSEETGNIQAEGIIDFYRLQDLKYKAPGVSQAVKDRGAFVMPTSTANAFTTAGPKKAKAATQKPSASKAGAGGEKQLTLRETKPITSASSTEKSVAEAKVESESEKGVEGEQEDATMADVGVFLKGDQVATPHIQPVATNAIVKVDGMIPDGHIGEGGWTYSAEYGTYFPPTGPLNGLPKWACNKCHKKEKFQHLFFVNPDGTRFGTVNNCAQCNRNSYKKGKWTPVKPWETSNSSNTGASNNSARVDLGGCD
jgi:hypothetical protein